MKTFEKGQEKISKICAILRDEALEPAKKEAEDILKEAQKQAKQIITDAQNEAKGLIEQAKSSIEQERKIFQTSLSQAAKQSLEALKQTIEHKLFNEQLEILLTNQPNDSKLIANLINAIVNAMEREGLSAEIAAIIPKSVPATDVIKLLLEKISDRLKNHSIMVGDFKGGAQVKLVDKKLTIDVTDEYLLELLVSYVRRDFRRVFFES